MQGLECQDDVIHTSAQWIGRRREQQDSVRYIPIAGGVLGIVCDGMGGHIGGAQASALVADTFMHYFATSAHEDIPLRMEEALYIANDELSVNQTENGESGTTLLAVFIRHHQLWWISVGDSPLYLWRAQDRDQFDRLNEDHSMRQIADDLYRQGKISLQRALQQRSVLLSAVMGGIIERVDICQTPLNLQSGDTVLACSDGLQVWKDMLRAPGFAALKEASDADPTCSVLTQVIMGQVKDLMEPQQDNASFWLARVK